MSRHIAKCTSFSVVVTLLFTSFFAVPARVNGATETYWSGKSAGFDVSWSDSDIIAKQGSDGQTVFSAQQVARAFFAKMKPKGLDFTCEQDFKVLSLVGPILSLQYHYYASQSLNGEPAEAHPDGGTIYFAVDLRKPGDVVKLIFGALGAEEVQVKAVDLTDVFLEPKVISAVRDDKVVKASADVGGAVTAEQLLQRIHNAGLQGPGLCGTFTRWLLNGFAFHHLHRGNVAVRLGVTGSGPCRENLTELGVWLPMAPWWKQHFEAASKGTAGVMMQKLEKVAAGKRTAFSWNSKATVKKKTTPKKK